MFGKNFESIPKKEEIVYETQEMEAPEILKEKGYEGSVSVKVQRENNGLIVIVDGRFKEGIDSLDILPTAAFLEANKYSEDDAKRLADNMLEELISRGDVSEEPIDQKMEKLLAKNE